MKIKTITSHDVYNYGASLQAYALMTYLNSLGHETEIIDYKPEYVLRKYNYMWVNPESGWHINPIKRNIYRCLKFIQRQLTKPRKHSFDRFTRKYLQTTKTYHSNEELKSNPPFADIYIVGSDQVWNTFYDAGRDPAFYLDFVPTTSKRISYAASFSFIEINDFMKETISNYLHKFNAISVREYQGINILKEMQLEGEWVLDPIFLLPVEHWKSIMSPFSKKEKFILVYDFERNSDIKSVAQQLKAKTGYKIYSINDNYPLFYADKNYNAAGPIEFLTLIYHCDYFLSNSFHGTAFSILFQKNFFVFPRHRHKVNSRMESLLKLFQLEERLIPICYKKDSIYKNINYIPVSFILKQNIVKSKQYLKNNLTYKHA